MKKLSSGLLFSTLVLSGGCRNLFSPDQSVILGVSKLSAPSTVAATSPLDVVVTVNLGGCLSFDRIEVQRFASDGSITVWGKDSSLGRKDVMCPQNIILEDHSYRFDPPFAGAFTVTVNRGRLPPLQATVQVQ